MWKCDWQQWHLLATCDNCAGGLGMLPSSRLGWRASVTSHSVLHGSLFGIRDPATGWSLRPNKILPYITHVCMVLQLEGENRVNNIKISWPEANEEFVFGVIFFFFLMPLLHKQNQVWNKERNGLGQKASIMKKLTLNKPIWGNKPQGASQLKVGPSCPVVSLLNWWTWILLLCIEGGGEWLWQ